MNYLLDDFTADKKEADKKERQIKENLLTLVERKKGGLGLYSCRCGGQIIARITNVNYGSTRSCGCLRGATWVNNFKW